METVIQLWLDAEEENRKHTNEGEEKCLELKDKFSDEFSKLSLDNKKEVVEYLESVGA
jgi:vacuolar-type H+-ATPase subunit H